MIRQTQFRLTVLVAVCFCQADSLVAGSGHNIGSQPTDGRLFGVQVSRLSGAASADLSPDRIIAVRRGYEGGAALNTGRRKTNDERRTSTDKDGSGETRATVIIGEAHREDTGQTKMLTDAQDGSTGQTRGPAIGKARDGGTGERRVPAIGKARDGGTGQTRGSAIGKAQDGGTGRTRGSAIGKAQDGGTGRTRGSAIGKAQDGGTGRTRGSAIGKAQDGGTGRTRGSTIGKTQDGGAGQRIGSTIGKAEDRGTGQTRGSTIGKAQYRGSSRTRELAMAKTQDRGSGRTRGLAMAKTQDRGSSRTRELAMAKTQDRGSSRTRGLAMAKTQDRGSGRTRGLAMAKTQDRGSGRTRGLAMAKTQDRGSGRTRGLAMGKAPSRVSSQTNCSECITNGMALSPGTTQPPSYISSTLKSNSQVDSDSSKALQKQLSTSIENPAADSSTYMNTSPDNGDGTTSTSSSDSTTKSNSWFADASRTESSKPIGEKGNGRNRSGGKVEKLIKNRGALIAVILMVLILVLICLKAFCKEKMLNYWLFCIRCCTSDRTSDLGKNISYRNETQKEARCMLQE